MRSRAPATGTPASTGITRSSPPRADTGEVLHIRDRQGRANTQARRRAVLSTSCSLGSAAPATAPRSSSAPTWGFEHHKLMNTLEGQGVGFSIAVKQSNTVRALIDQLPGQECLSVEDHP
jgi:hypothetical protein